MKIPKLVYLLVRVLPVFMLVSATDGDVTGWRVLSGRLGGLAKKRSIVRMIGVGAAIMVLAGCGGNTSTTTVVGGITNPSQSGAPGGANTNAANGMSTPASPIGPTINLSVQGFSESMAQVAPVVRITTMGGVPATPGSHYLEFQIVVKNLQSDRPAPYPDFMQISINGLAFIQVANPVCDSTTACYADCPLFGAQTLPSGCLMVYSGSNLRAEIPPSGEVLQTIDSQNAVDDTTKLGAMQFDVKQVEVGQADYVLPLRMSSGSSASASPLSESTSSSSVPSSTPAASGQPGGLSAVVDAIQQSPSAVRDLTALGLGVAGLFLIAFAPFGWLALIGFVIALIATALGGISLNCELASVNC